MTMLRRKDARELRRDENDEIGPPRCALLHKRRVAEVARGVPRPSSSLRVHDFSLVVRQDYWDAASGQNPGEIREQERIRVVCV